MKHGRTGVGIRMCVCGGLGCSCLVSFFFLVKGDGPRTSPLTKTTRPSEPD